MLEPLGLTHPQYLVMLALWEHSPRSLGDLADELAMEPATLSPLVKRLEAQGRVTRARRAEDERVLDIALTDAGRALREARWTCRARSCSGSAWMSASSPRCATALVRFAGRTTGPGSPLSRTRYRFRCGP